MKKMLTVVRDNAAWLADLRTAGPAREAALTDLRACLVEGLRQGLVGHVETAGPEFEALAEDFAQETLLKVLAHLDEFRGQSQFITWAYKIAVRVALTELRRRRWQDVSLDDLQEMDESPGDFVPPALADSAPGPEATAEQADWLARLERMLAEELTEKQRRAMVAVTVQGLPIGEVARQMGMDRNALYKLLHDGRLRLRRRLARDGLSPDELLSVFDRG